MWASCLGYDTDHGCENDGENKAERNAFENAPGDACPPHMLDIIPPHDIAEVERAHPTVYGVRQRTKAGAK